MKEHLSQYLEEHQLSAQAIPVVLVAHEIAGFGWLTGLWYGCYRIQPAKLVASLANARKVEEYMEIAQRSEPVPCLLRFRSDSVLQKAGIME